MAVLLPKHVCMALHIYLLLTGYHAPQRLKIIRQSLTPTTPKPTPSSRSSSSSSYFQKPLSSSSRLRHPPHPLSLQLLLQLFVPY
jgi:hypothetical protein